jgi:hypothetical protein
VVTVAALYVQKSGCYYGLPGVDPWDAERDARLYAGPHPVVAHPPCNRWAMPLAKVNETRYGHKVGDDGGCFESALNAVRTWGGVLEHPANTAAWRAHGLPKPLLGGGWIRGFCGGWVCQVSQCAYGHPARKRTWLYYVGSQPPALDWSEPPHVAVTSWLRGTKLPRITKKEACKTPIPFRDALLSMARSARTEAA